MFGYLNVLNLLQFCLVFVENIENKMFFALILFLQKRALSDFFFKGSFKEMTIFVGLWQFIIIYNSYVQASLFPFSPLILTVCIKVKLDIFDISLHFLSQLNCSQ